MEKNTVIDGIFSYLSHMLRSHLKQILFPSPWQNTEVSPSGSFTMVLGSARTGLIFTGLQEGAQPGVGG